MLQEVEASKISRHMKVARLLSLRTGRLYLQEISLVLIYDIRWVDTRVIMQWPHRNMLHAFDDVVNVGYVFRHRGQHFTTVVPYCSVPPLNLYRLYQRSSTFFAMSVSFPFSRILAGRGVRGGVVGWGTALQTGRSRVRFPMESQIFQWLNPSGRIVELGSTQPLTEMNTRNPSWG
jgi:hypothetical protein